MNWDTTGCLVVLALAALCAAIGWTCWNAGFVGAAFALGGAVAAILLIGIGADSQNWNLVETVVIIVIVAVLYGVIAVNVRARLAQEAVGADQGTRALSPPGSGDRPAGTRSNG